MPHHQIGKIICPVVQPGGKMRESGDCKSEFKRKKLGRVNQISLTLQGVNNYLPFIFYKIQNKIVLCYF
jgi:hypothetical protein